MTFASFRSFLPLLVATVFAGILTGQTNAGGLMSPFATFPKIGNYKVTNRSVYDSWSRHRLPLGKALCDEFTINTLPGHSRATAMRFENGFIVRNASSPRVGETSAVIGAIWTKYQQLGGPNGRLGLPTGDSHEVSQTPTFPMQNFEHGQIYFNITVQHYDVHWFGE